MKKFALATVISALILLAADVSGKWKGRIVVEGADNDMDVTMVLNQSSDGLRGTIGSAQEGAAPIVLVNPKLEGDKVTFDVPYRGQTFHFSLTAAGAGISGTLKGATEDGSPVSGTVKFTKSN
jgi:hypothetical protein